MYDSEDTAYEENYLPVSWTAAILQAFIWCVLINSAILQ